MDTEYWSLRQRVDFKKTIAGLQRHTQSEIFSRMDRALSLFMKPFFIFHFKGRFLHYSFIFQRCYMCTRFCVGLVPYSQLTMQYFPFSVKNPLHVKTCFTENVFLSLRVSQHYEALKGLPRQNLSKTSKRIPQYENEHNEKSIWCKKLSKKRSKKSRLFLKYVVGNKSVRRTLLEEPKNIFGINKHLLNRLIPPRRRLNGVHEECNWGL